MRNLNYVRIVTTNIIEVPQHAFRPLNGHLDKLKYTEIWSPRFQKLGNYAFYNLDSLSEVRFVHNSLDSIPSNAFHFPKESKENIDIYVDHTLLNASDIDFNAFSNIRRPASIIFNYDALFIK